MAPADKIPCSLEGEEATLDVGPVGDIVLDVRIDELALVVDASVTLEGMSLSLICTMIGLAPRIPVYTKIVSIHSVTYEVPVEI